MTMLSERLTRSASAREAQAREGAASKIARSLTYWRIGIVVSAVVVVHVFCFYWWISSDYFFSGDGLFYFSRLLSSVGEAWSKLIGLDELYMYRPLPYIVFSFFLYPLFGITSTPYHIVSYLIASATAVLTCVTIYFWTGRNKSLTWLACIFVLLNPLNFFPSFGLDYIDVWLSIFFYNLALVLIITGRKSLRVLIPICAALALLSREHSVLLPVEATLILIAMGLPLRAALSKTRSAWAVLVLYAAFQLYIRGGGVYAPDTANENLRFKFSVSRVEVLVKNMKPAIFFPENPHLNPLFGDYRRHVRLAFVVPWFVMMIWAILRRNKLALSGLIWVPISLLPIAFIQMEPAPRHYYMAVPGLAILFASFVRSTRLLVPLMVIFSAVTVSSVAMYAEESYASVGGRLTKMYLSEIHRTVQHTGRSEFYVVDSGDRYFLWHIDGGTALKHFLGRDVSFRFASIAQPLSMDRLLANQINVIVPRWEGLEDAIATEQFPNYLETNSCASALRVLHANAQCATFYRGMQLKDADRQMAQTPTGLPFFEMNGETVMLSRTTLFLRNTNGVRLVGNAMVSPNSADGVLLQIFTKNGDRFYQRRTIPAAPGERVHMDERVAPSDGSVVVFRISPGPNGNEKGDWLFWRSD